MSGLGGPLTAPLRLDVAEIYVECLYWYQRPFARWLWVWPHALPSDEWREATHEEQRR